MHTEEHTQDDSVLPTEEESTRVKAAIAEMERTAPDRLDSLARMVSMWSSILFGVVLVLAVASPPLFLMLRGNPPLRVVLTATLLCYLAAAVLGQFALFPRTYARYANNMTRQQRELDKIISHKMWLTRGGMLMFLLGSVALVVLIIRVIVL